MMPGAPNRTKHQRFITMTLPVNTNLAAGGAEGIRFVCPTCRLALQAGNDVYHCRHCADEFRVSDGIHCFFIDSRDAGVTEIGRYTESFRRPETAAAYQRSFERIARKRWRTRRELSVLDELLGGDPGPSVLNIPCGSGRLSPPLHNGAGTLLEADSSPGQLSLNRGRFGDCEGRIWMTASAFDIPLPDDAVETVVCARLSHHLNCASERARLLGELLRVARRRVVFSFRNRASLSSWSRRLRGKPVHSTAMSVADVRLIARRHDARVVRCRSVSNLGARHTYALIEKVTSAA